MHDLNRTQLESGWETGLAGESEYEDFESEYEASDYEDFEDEDYEYEDFEDEDFEDEMYPELYGESYDGYEDFYGEAEGPLDEAEEMELASQLLEIGDEQELDYFLGKLIGTVAKKVRKYVPSSIRKRLAGYAKKLLPVAGAALGNLVAPGVGGLIGGKLATLGSKAFGLELEGLSPEDQEFEAARRYVRLVSDAAQEATLVPRTTSPQTTVKKAFQASAQKHAPGLIAIPNGRTAPYKNQMQLQRGFRNRKGNRVRVVQIHPGDKLVKLVIVRG